jgi:anti-sigma factor RsiW
MKCEECTASALEELLDGELDERRATEMSAHLAACHACSLRYDELLDEQTIYASYERDVEVTPQMWAGVAAGIAAAENSAEAKPRGASLFRQVREWFATAFVAPRFSPVLTAALVLFAIGATATVMKYLNSQANAPREVANNSQPGVAATPANVVQQPAPEAAPGAASPDATPHSAPSDAGANVQPDGREKTPKPEAQRRRDAERTKPAAAAAVAVPANDPAQLLIASQNSEQLKRQRATARLVREAESKYVAAIKLLSEDVNRKRTRLDPQVAARFDETLATIDRSIAETRRTVLKQRSSDPVAVQYMLSAYAKKVEVMREMAALD